MMCSKLLRAHRATATTGKRVVKFIDVRFERLRNWYQLVLERSLSFTPVTAVFVVIVLISIALLYRSAQERTRAAGGSGLYADAVDLRAGCDLQRKLCTAPGVRAVEQGASRGQNVFQIDAPGQSFIGNILAPFAKRPGRTEIQRNCSRRLEFIAGPEDRCSSSPRCPAPSASRCNSPSRPPSPRCV
jgi:multidrug efflux pump